MGRIALPILCLALVHISVLTSRPILALVLFFLGCVAGLWSSLRTHGSIKVILFYGISGSVLAVIMILSALDIARLESAIYAPPVLISTAIAIFFGMTLRPGVEPVITTWARIHHEDGLPEALQKYTRRLTLIWTLLLAAMAIELAALPFLVNMTTWSWITNVVNPLILVTFFIGQLAYRTIHYRSYGKVEWIGAFRKIFRAGNL